MATYGNVGEFKESEESWTQYAERLEQYSEYFAANEIEDEKKQRAILLEAIILWKQNVHINSRFVTTQETRRCRFKRNLREAGKPFFAEAKCYRRAVQIP